MENGLLRPVRPRELDADRLLDLEGERILHDLQRRTAAADEARAYPGMGWSPLRGGDCGTRTMGSTAAGLAFPSDTADLGMRSSGALQVLGARDLAEPSSTGFGSLESEMGVGRLGGGVVTGGGRAGDSSSGALQVLGAVQETQRRRSRRDAFGQFG